MIIFNLLKLIVIIFFVAFSFFLIITIPLQYVESSYIRFCKGRQGGQPGALPAVPEPWSRCEWNILGEQSRFRDRRLIWIVFVLPTINGFVE